MTTALASIEHEVCCLLACLTERIARMQAKTLDLHSQDGLGLPRVKSFMEHDARGSLLRKTKTRIKQGGGLR